MEKKSVSLLGVAEIAELLNVSKQVISNWRVRDGAFPAPAAELRSGPVWLQEDVSSWANANGVRMAGPPQAPTHEDKKTVVVAMMNAKGGVGKSTLTMNLAWFCFLQYQKRVLLVDLDPQFNLSQYALGSDAYEKLILNGKTTVSDIFSAAAGQGIDLSKTGRDAVYRIRAGKGGAYLDLIPSDLNLAWVARDTYFKQEMLDNYLKHTIGKNHYDLILIDCPPTDSMLTDAAYTASDFLLIPVKPEFLPAIGLPLIDRSLQRFRHLKTDSKVQVAGIVLNAASPSKDEYRRSKADILKASRLFGWPMFKTELSLSDSYPRGSRQGLPIFMTNYARWEKVTEFSAFASEFIGRIGL